jgi:hypothetical protein
LDYAGNGTGVSIKGAAIFMKVWGIATILASGDLGDKLNNYFTSVIRGYAFNSCASLTDIDLSSATATSFDGGAVFYDCWKLLTVKLPVGITSITDGNFRNCAALTDLYWYYGQIPSFGSQVFENCATNGVLHVTSAYATAQGISTDSPVTNWSTLSGWTYDVIMS